MRSSPFSTASRYSIRRTARREAPIATPRGISSPLIAGPTLVPRSLMTSARAIRRRMADDLRELAAALGAVCHDDLTLLGWKAAQIAEHASHAAQLAHTGSMRNA